MKGPFQDFLRINGAGISQCDDVRIFKRFSIKGLASSTKTICYLQDTFLIYNFVGDLCNYENLLSTIFGDNEKKPCEKILGDSFIRTCRHHVSVYISQTKI